MEADFVLENLKKRRLALGMTQKDIALKLFMDERTYSKIERGLKKSLDLNMMFSLAEILGTTVVDMLQQAEDTQRAADTCQPDMLKDIIDMLEQVSEQQIHLAKELGNIKEQLA